ncbi:MAG: START domain-containing protein [Chitinophagales bacterium]|nr:START domain-containing protein [Chitinophagales bacterium]
MQRTLFIFFFLSLFSFPLLFAQDGWQLERDKNGVKVYTRKTQTSNMKDSRAIAVVNSDTREVLNLLLDFENHWKWMDRIKISRTLKKISDNEFYVYYEALAPWPVSNRDVVTKYKVKLSPDGKVMLEAIGEPNYIPAKDGIVRIPESISSWEIIPLENNKVQIIFTSHSDPGGSIPDWLANTTATDNPFNKLLKLKEQVEK